MADLRTEYLGLKLKNPVLASSSGITGTVGGVKQCAEAGVGAVVLQSLFEEQINAELGGGQGSSGSAFPDEARAYLQNLARSHGPDDYLSLIAGARDAVDVPVIASINCTSADRWTDYAARIEAAGADALELNIALMPLSFDERAEDIEAHLLSIVRAVRESTRLPIAVKVGPYFTALPRVVTGLREAGVNGVVLFNRFYQLDIDPVALKPVPGNRFSTSDELPLPLRWMSILSPRIACDFSLSTGVHTGLDAAKAIVAGARVVQIASALYVRKVRGATEIISELSDWLDTNGYADVAAARGRFAESEHYRPEELERLQYVKALTAR
ncbi:MAG: dihydroorotate dehydrogenase-like protein [Spirochaetaceae bacterium]|nr:MAG: dihydroorotate dehydrogenase-like protein [Spirochaetaceae bacterium]